MSQEWSWGHSLKEYILMFDLSSDDFVQPILDVAAGASSFNWEMKHRGYKVISCDPLYALPADEVVYLSEKMVGNLAEHIRRHPERYHWGEEFSNPSELERQQQDKAQIFCNDFERGLRDSRYLSDALPRLSFKDKEFQLALCANFLFDGNPQPDLQFQIDAIHELCRVAQEVRIYPLIDAKGEISPNLGPILTQLQMEDYAVEVRQVSYRFFKYGNAMLSVSA